MVLKEFKILAILGKMADLTKTDFLKKQNLTSKHLSSHTAKSLIIFKIIARFLGFKYMKFDSKILSSSKVTDILPKALVLTLPKVNLKNTKFGGQSYLSYFH